LQSLCFALTLCAATSISASAQFKTLVDFDATNGAYPEYMSLAQGTDGNLYGTSAGWSSGIVFRMTPTGELTTIYTFCQQGGTCSDGSAPYAGLLLGTDGVFYGTTFSGGSTSNICVDGCGTVFKITRNGVLTTLHAFDLTDGANPVGALIQGTDGNLYGTTEFGGSGNCANLDNSGCGTIFKISPKNGFAVLHTFNGTDGWNVHGGLIEGTDGNLYGTTAQGGTNNGGNIFRITPQGQLTNLYSFCSETNCSDGESPYAALMQANNGNFYGTTLAGGTTCGFDNSGTIFKITPQGALTTLATFCPSDAPLIQGSDGNLYGTTNTGGYSSNSSCYAAFGSGCGTAFKIVSGNVLTILHNFDMSDGDIIIAGLVQATNGTFYGTSSVGGADSYGTIFSLSGKIGPFITFIQPTGRVGKSVQILGQGLTGTTGVTFNGVPATTFKVVSDTYMTAVVPSGATTGLVVATTLSGALSSNKKFTVSK
jgi:uncharacterized repeat protein (TIGR03803 family)